MKLIKSQKDSTKYNNRMAEGMAKMGEGIDNDRLFALYCSRISTIDRFKYPITDKGLPAAYRSALTEAKLALDVFNNSEKGNN